MSQAALRVNRPGEWLTCGYADQTAGDGSVSRCREALTHLTSPPAEAGGFNPRGLSFLLLRQRLPRTNGKGRGYAQQSYASSTDLTSRQPGGRPGQLGHRRPDATEATTYLRVVGGERRSALAAHRLSLPCSAGVRFLPRLKAGVSTEESR